MRNIRLIVFGGADASNNLLGDTWFLANANGLGGTPSWSPAALSSRRGERESVSC